MVNLDAGASTPARIKVVGAGGGGCNAVNRMVQDGIQGVELFAVNTDLQSLNCINVPNKIQIGERLTRGLGAGGDPEKAAKAAEESIDVLTELVSDADMIFVTAGMGGGTGTAITPVIANLAKENGTLTIGIVTKPFDFEGKRRSQVAESGIENLTNNVDTLIIIPNQRLLALCDEKVLMSQAFKMADGVLHQGVQSITDLLTIPGEINLDFADVKAVMNNAGPAWMAIGQGTGQNRAEDAAAEALRSPLLDVSIDGATGVLFNVTGGGDLTLHEVEKAAEVIKRSVDPEANIIFGIVFNEEMEKEVRITLVATGFTADKHAISSEEQLPPLPRGLDAEKDLDIPSFLRNPNSSSRGQEKRKSRFF